MSLIRLQSSKYVEVRLPDRFLLDLCMDNHDQRRLSDHVAIKMTYILVIMVTTSPGKQLEDLQFGEN